MNAQSITRCNFHPGLLPKSLNSSKNLTLKYSKWYVTFAYLYLNSWLSLLSQSNEVHDLRQGQQSISVIKLLCPSLEHGGTTAVTIVTWMVNMELMMSVVLCGTSGVVLATLWLELRWWWERK